MEEYLLELNIQIGHVIYAAYYDKLLNMEEVKEKFRDVHNLGDELADVIMQLFTLDYLLGVEFVNQGECKITEKTIRDLILLMPIICGQIQDAYLRAVKYKQGMGRADSEEWDMIGKSLGKLFSLCIQLANLANLDLEREYELMLEDANHYLDSISMKNDGRYSEIERHSGQIYKTIVISEIKKQYDEQIILEVMQNYFRQLREEGWKVAELLEVTQKGEDLCIVQKYILGLRLDEYLMHEAKGIIHEKRQLKILGSFEEILSKIINMYISNPNIRVDSNICNFIVDETDSIILVDIFPPILLERMKMEQKNEYLNKLEQDIVYQVLTYMYYFCRAVVRGTQSKDYIVMRDLLKKIYGILKRELRKLDLGVGEDFWMEENYYPFGERLKDLQLMICKEELPEKEQLEALFEWSFAKMLL